MMDRFRQGRQVAGDQAGRLGNQAVDLGAKYVTTRCGGLRVKSRAVLCHDRSRARHRDFDRFWAASTAGLGSMAGANKVFCCEKKNICCRLLGEF
jgi:hypothetical protein